LVESPCAISTFTDPDTAAITTRIRATGTTKAVCCETTVPTGMSTLVIHTASLSTAVGLLRGSKEYCRLYVADPVTVQFTLQLNGTMDGSVFHEPLVPVVV